MEAIKDMESQLKQLLKSLEEKCLKTIQMIVNRDTKELLNSISQEIENVCQQ